MICTSVSSAVGGRVRAVVVVLTGLLAVLALLVAPEAQAQTEEPTRDPTDRACALAQSLNAQARPQDARALIDEHRAAAAAHRRDCAPEYFEAQARTSLATVVSALADDAALAPLRGQLADVCGTSAGTRSEVLAACDVAVSTEQPTTWSEDVASSLAVFVERWAEPLRDLALAVVGFLAAVYVLARVRTRRLSPTQYAVLARIGASRRGAKVATGVVVLAATAAFVFLVVWAPRASGDTPVIAAVAVGVLALTAWAVDRLARLLASSLRIAVTVRGADGKESTSATTHVIGILNELGARGPRGAQFPRGTDVSALDTAVISALPAGAVAKLLLAVLHVLVPRAPWEVSVDEESVDRETVEVTHNGRSALVAVVDRDALGLRTPVLTSSGSLSSEAVVLPDLHRMSAALVLAKLHEVHRFPGLGGATDGLSVGFQAVATSDFARDYDAAAPLLARAVGLDSANLAATLGLLHCRFRSASTAPDLELYVDELAALLDRLERLSEDDPAGATLLICRARLNRLVARINLAFADGGDGAAGLECSRELAKALVTDVDTLLTASAVPAESITLLRAIGRNARILMVVGTDTGFLEPPLTPLEHHQAACHDATAPTPALERAVHHLRLAAAEPQLAAWRALDPQLADFRRTDTYRAAFPPDKDEFFSLPGIARLKDHLTRLGITGERDLLAHSPTELAQLLGTTSAVADRLLALSRLVSRVPADLHPWRFTIGSWVARKARPGLTRAELAEAVDEDLAEELTAGEITALQVWVREGSCRRSDVADYLRAAA
ncbi:hypothetical protein M3148_01940 [Georgenia satyanarayanai]|uniref:hypothetical protein n=1 Tax=Georgenia satyanarayanai TaxID=860221 RepID=UPI00203F39BB|nr:hypothetical protein [Georgenia satyanarayanai]MCM3659760.1 hypothetical protein [Georgenia satyanarayanai]